MVSTLPLTPSSSDYYKHANETFLGFLPPQDQAVQPNYHHHHHDMQQHGFRMLLGQEDYFSPSATTFGDIDDLAVPEITSFDCLPTYSVSLEGVDHDQYLPALSECKVYANCSSGHGDYLGESGFGVGCYQVYENGGEGGNPSSAMLENYVPPNNYCAATAMESWGIQGQMSTPTSAENNNIKVGRYSVEERRARILRYLKKRNQRNFNKTIKYACRKALADRRVRIHGRFAKNQEDDQPLTNDTATPHEENLAVPYINTDKNEEYYEDEWLQQAMASLICVPCMPGWHGQAAVK